MLHFRRFPIIIRICLKDHLLSLIPLFHNITAGTNRVLSIIRAIGMFRKDTCDRHGVWPDRIRPFHMEYYGSIICGLCLVQHGKIIYCTVITKRIIGKRHILCCQRFPVCKLHIRPDGHCPGHAILIGLHICSQVISNGQIFICHSQCTLDQRFMNMFPCAPAINRVKTCLWF